MIATRSFAASDWPVLRRRLAQSFNAPAEGWDVFRARIGDANFRVADRDGELAGGCAIYPMGQWWVGRSVALGGIAGVGVFPEHRGRGVAKAMMTDVLRLLHTRRVPVAGLYPATQQVYRAVGYEQAGSRVLYEAPLASLSGFRMEVEARDVAPAQAIPEFARRYRPTHGNLDRSQAIWDRFAKPYVGERYGWLLGEDGYLIVEHDGDREWNLRVLDYCAPSAPTARTLLALCAGHRSMADTVQWYGSPADPLIFLFAEPTWKIKEDWRWMLRIVDLKAALEGRGWAQDGELHLDVEDALLTHNAGRWRVRVQGGAATAERGGEGSLRCAARALGPLYSGFMPASRLRELGVIDGPVDAADRLFAAPHPWMRELY